MLVVTRKNGESIIIGDDIEVTVIKTGKDRVKLGIHAPKDVNVARKELIETKNINKEAALSNENISDIMKSLKKLM